MDFEYGQSDGLNAGDSSDDSSGAADNMSDGDSGSEAQVSENIGSENPGPENGGPGDEPSPAVIPEIPTVGASVDWVKVVSLTLDNFKSFEKRTTIPFRQGFTTISGPNGSGKSNVIDSVMFVLGLASSKGMRAERLTDLLNTSSNKKYARVTLKLRVCKDGQERDMEISRRVRRTRSGYVAKYEVDGEVKKASELNEVLIELGLSANGLNVVLQGDVMRLTNMSPLNRRRVLDEIAGVSEFDKRIKAAREELAQASRQMEDVQLILAELEARLQSLTKERDTALKYKNLKEVQDALEEDVQLLDAQIKRDNVARIEGQVADLEKRRDKLKVSLEKSIEALEERRKDLDKAEAEYKEKGEGERLSAFKKREDLLSEISRVEEQLRASKQRIEQSQKKEKEWSVELEKVKLKEQALAPKEKEAQDKLDEFGKRHEQLAQEVNKAMAQIRQQSTAQADRIGELNQLQLVLRSRREKDRELERRESELVEREAKLDTECEILTKTVLDQGSRRDSVARLQAEIATKRRIAREELGQEETRGRRLITRIHQIRDLRDRSFDEVNDVERRLARAQEQVRSVALYTNSRALNLIQSSGLTGVHGSVRELCGFDPENAAALEAAAGSRLSWVVVDNEQVAKKAIELLKRNKAGRLTFAPLTKIRPPRVSLTKGPGNGVVDYALNLVDFDDAYEEVFRYVFGDTLVVEDLKTGLKLIGKHRMVTLDGDLLEKRGLMTGGHRRSSSTALANMAKAEKDARELKARLDALLKSRRKLAAEERQVGEESAKVEEALKGLRGRVSEAGASHGRLTEELEEIDKILQPAKERLTVVEKDLKTVRKELAEVTGERDQLGEKLAGDDKRFSELSGDVEGSEFERLSNLTREREVEMRGIEETLSLYRERLQQSLLERQGFKERQEMIKMQLDDELEQRAELQDTIAGLETRKVEQKQELGVLDEELGKIKKELDALDERRKEAQRLAQEADTLTKQTKKELDASELGLEGAKDKVTAAKAIFEETCQDLQAKGLDVDLPERPEGGYEEGEDPRTLKNQVETDLKKTVKKIQNLGPVNMLAIAQYDELAERQKDLQERFNTLTSEKEALLKRMDDLEEAKRTTFLQAFTNVRESFRSAFRELAHGEGELFLENEEDPFAGGLIIQAQPRGKNFTRLEAMSGGEKSLTALAFIFALQSFNPAPFYILDEVDQNLDGANTELLALAIQKRSRLRQYLVVSHHQAMINESDQLLGVSMQKGKGTKVTGIPLKKTVPAGA